MSEPTDEIARLREENACLRAELSAVRARAAVVDNLADAVVLTDADRIVRGWNPAAERLYGYRADEMVGTSASVLETRVVGMEYDAAERLLAEDGAWQGECTQRCKDGHRVHVAMAVKLLRGPEGEVSGFVGVNRDIGAYVEARAQRRREAERAVQIAALAHELATEPSALARVLDICARGVGRLLDDAVTVVLRVPDSDRLIVAAHTDADPERETWGRAFYEREPLRVGAGIAGRVVATGEPLMLDAPGREHMLSHLESPYREAALARGLQGVVCVPLVARGAVIGALTCIRFRSEPHDAEDLRFLRNLAGHAALAVANARLHDEAFHTQEALRARTRELELAVEELEAFAYSVSHDVRAPLRSIEGLAQLVEDELGPTLGEEPRDWLRRLRSATMHLAELVDALLALSRVSRWRLQPADVDFSALAADVCAELAGREPDRAVEAVVGEGLHAFGDAGLLRIALMNLLENAWKFTRRVAHPQVEVGQGHDVTGRTVYFVRDNGAGFDPAFSARLFEPFERLHRPEDFPGTGVGLATVSRVVRRHGGDVWAESSPGLGATFFFTLGAAPGPPREDVG